MKLAFFLSHKTKTKIIASIKKDYDTEFLKTLIDSGIRSFRVNGAYFQYPEYQKLLQDLKILFMEINDKPTVIFDLKGPIPRISKISGSNIQNNGKEVKKNQLLKIVYDNPKIDDEDVIHVDKQFFNCLSIGDRIVVDSSNCVLKVICIDRFQRKNSLSKPSGYKSMQKITSEPRNIQEYADLYSECFDIDDAQSRPSLSEFPANQDYNSVQSKIEDELDLNVYLSADERVKLKQSNIKHAYQQIIKKHQKDLLPYAFFSDERASSISEESSIVNSRRLKFKIFSKKH